jgi:hypothetical protein
MASSSPAVQLGSTRRESPLPPGSPWYKHLWRGWKRVGRFIGDLISRVVTSIAYVLLLPFALGVRPADPLGLRPRPSTWHPLPPPPTSIDEARGGI